MATPMRVYREIAARHGVDPKNEEAVEKFYNEILPVMDPSVHEEVFTELLDRDGEPEELPTVDC